jgi:hypothetical protein
MVASVLNFNALAHFICFVASVEMLVVCDHYFDDYCEVDPASAGSSAQDALRLVHIILGLDIEMDKRQASAPSNELLGVSVSIATAHRHGGYAEVSTTPKRVSKILGIMRACATAGRLLPAAAGKLAGMLGFALQPAMFKFGRAAAHPFIRRQHSKAGSDRSWTRSMQYSFDFFSRVLPSLPPLRVPMSGSRRTPVLVYTDASFHHRRGKRVAWLGFYVLDPSTGKDYYSRLRLPQAYFKCFAPGKRTYIAQVELLVANAVYRTLPELLRDRAVMHFIDNTVALSAIVKGYATQPDCAGITNSFHEAMLQLRCHLWCEWVPSAANIGDWPSRPDKVHLVPKSAKFVTMVLPAPTDLAALFDE